MQGCVVARRKQGKQRLETGAPKERIVYLELHKAAKQTCAGAAKRSNGSLESGVKKKGMPPGRFKARRRQA